jgi:hypothetical protein
MAKRKGFALVFGVPLLILVLVTSFFGNFNPLPSLAGGAVGCILVGFWYRRRLARQRRQ